ncbi:Cobalt ABC transporter, ATPase subunit [[Clostridium] ultunense Esp]|uniref:energy-coupling factor ABC transporter ATP-binding protein n=1 Tax=Thermicanus aegyptius TaxID=94009 RepID=UPI0002B704C4|nr:ATP-binding cassette domain-containing protein [Thermicanus aegyptius]CCQ96316.1 Cobalt ABC transporter, ATPase subunit [[Clostridium] ultunense Esp]
MSNQSPKTSPTPLFQFKNLSYRYSPKAPLALKELTFTIREHVKTAIIGANGSGKSTTLFHMNGLFRVQEGSLFYRGREVKGREKELVKEVGVLFQDPDDQIVSLTVWEDLLFGPLQFGYSYEEAKERAREAMEILQIEPLAERSPHELSFGQKKQVALAGLLAVDPPTILLDEPMAFLDPKGKERVQAIMEELHQRGKNVIITTHDMQLVADWAEEVIILHQGSSLGQMSPRKLFTMPHLLEQASLHLPPVADLMREIWRGDPEEMPIRVEEARGYLRSL